VPDQVASVDTREDIGGDDRATVRYWMAEIENAKRVFRPWWKEADRIVAKYRDDADRKRNGSQFPIMSSNVNLQRQAVYNSPPIPDIRRRYGGPGNPVERDAANVLSRAISISLDNWSFDVAIEDAVMDMLLGGRGVVRIRHEPTMDEAGEPVWYECKAERVPYKDFLHQPEKDWQRVNWLAFSHYLDREQIRELSPKNGDKVKLNYSASTEEPGGWGKKNQEERDVFKRALVYEIWDRRKKEVLFIADSWRMAPLKIESDPLGLAEFYPCPRPIYADREPDSLIPLSDYRLYEDQAEELQQITSRIRVLVSALRFKGVQSLPLNIGEMLENAEDGDLVPVTPVDPTADLSKFIWFWPVERIAEVLSGLYVQREQVKQTIYEITGLSDIIRGTTDPNETLGAQRIKAQNATGRLAEKQRNTAKLIREILRVKAELIAEHWTPEIMSAATGVMVTPEVSALLSSDQMRLWRIDIETDSTVQADLSDARENVGQLIQGMAGFTQAIGPAVQAGMMTGAEATRLLSAFTAPFRLGRQAELVFDEIAARNEEQSQQQQASQQPDTARQEAEMSAQNDKERMMLEHQRETQRLQLEGAKTQAEIAREDRRLALEEQRTAADHRLNARKMQMDESAMTGQPFMDPNMEMMKQAMMMLAQGQDALSQRQSDGTAAIGQIISDAFGQLAAALGQLSAKSDAQLTAAVHNQTMLSQQQFEAITKLAKSTQQVAAAVTAPRSVTITRDESGKVTGGQSKIRVN